MPSNVFNLEHQLGFYGAYHSNPANILIHIIFVPCIMFSAQYFLTYYFHAPQSLAHISTNLHPNYNGVLGYLGADKVPLRLEFGGGTFMAMLYAAYYFCLEKQATMLYIPAVLLPMTLASTAMANLGDKWWTPMLALHVCSWIAQFAGHGIAEGRAPALLDNLLSAIVLAPFFTFMEVLFLMGYDPKLKRKIDHASAKKIVELNKEKRARQERAQMEGKKAEEQRQARWKEVAELNKGSLSAFEKKEIEEKLKSS